MLCDNDCGTVTCVCGIDYYWTKEKSVEGHSPECGVEDEVDKSESTPDVFTEKGKNYLTYAPNSNTYLIR
jgi:hypothetical protein